MRLRPAGSPLAPAGSPLAPAGSPLALAVLALALALSTGAQARPQPLAQASTAAVPGLPEALRCTRPGRPAAFAQDANSGQVLAARDADVPLPPASLTKVMTLHVALNAVRDGTARLDDIVAVRPGLPAQWAGRGASAGLTPGQRISIAELMASVGARSANDGAAALAEAIAGSQTAFIRRMEAERVRLGLGRSRFATVGGWSDGGRTCISARDAARLIGAVVDAHGALALRFLGPQALAPDAPGGPIAAATGAVALKTGWTAAAGRGVALDVRREGRRLLVATLGHPSDSARLEAAQALVEAALAKAGPTPSRRR
jgi:D-alanyl-D-alanine carboxypeptidase (penicillin-binding protein 5/6)